MDFPKAVKHMMIDADMSQIEIANKLNISKQNFYALLKKQDFRLNSDIINIADILGYDLITPANKYKLGSFTISIE